MVEGWAERGREGRAPVTSRSLAAVPSHPYGVTLLNCDGHSMTLGWKVPRFSGGAPILGYFIDKREARHQNWHEVNSAPVQERVLTVGADRSSVPRDPAQRLLPPPTLLLSPSPSPPLPLSPPPPSLPPLPSSFPSPPPPHCHLYPSPPTDRTSRGLCFAY